MTKKEILKLVQAGANVTVGALDYAPSELRDLAQAASSSGASIRLKGCHHFSCATLLEIARNGGKGVVTFEDFGIITD